MALERARVKAEMATAEAAMAGAEEATQHRNHPRMDRSVATAAYIDTCSHPPTRRCTPPCSQAAPRSAAHTHRDSQR